jgi:hypothetical protein
VESREWDQVHSKLAEIRVQLTRKAKTAGYARKRGTYKMIQVPIGRGGELESSEADVVKGLVVENHALIRVLDELVDRQCGIVRLDDCIGHLGGREDGEGQHDPVWVLFTDL